ncbi:Complex I intermediate-associated protein 30, mitochondrial [Anthophora quadrimaculata]
MERRMEKKRSRVVWKFDGTEKSLDQWIVNCDCDYGHGYSTAKLELSSNGTGIFHGVLDTTIPKNGQTTASGYCNITSTPKLKSFKRIAPNNWLRYNELVLRVRGDGRCYLINLLCDKRFDVTRLHAHNYLMYTRGGPHWQVVRIPFSKFVFTNKAQVHEIQFPIVPVNVSNLGITIADKISGPFRLEIDHISICFNPTIFEASAYEMYKVYRG